MWKRAFEAPARIKDAAESRPSCVRIKRRSTPAARIPSLAIQVADPCAAFLAPDLPQAHARLLDASDMAQGRIVAAMLGNMVRSFRSLWRETTLWLKPCAPRASGGASQQRQRLRWREWPGWDRLQAHRRARPVHADQSSTAAFRSSRARSPARTTSLARRRFQTSPAGQCRCLARSAS